MGLPRIRPGLPTGDRSEEEKVQERPNPGPLSDLSLGEEEKTELKKLEGFGNEGRALESLFSASAPVDPERFCLVWPKDTDSRARRGCWEED